MSITRRLSWILGVVFLVTGWGCKITQPSAIIPSSPKEEASSLLWKISGKEAQPSYLFGTIHMIEKEHYFFTAEMDSALTTSQGLALEIDLESAMDLSAQMGMLQQAFMKNDTTIKDLVSDEEYDLISNHFKEMGIPFMFLNRIKPMFLTIFADEDMFSGGSLKMDEIRSYELELVGKAKVQGMEVEGLETVEYQMGIFDRIPYKAQAQMLVQSISSSNEEEMMMDTLVHYYKMQDLEKLDELLNSDPTTKQYRSILLDDRNQNWIPIMSKLMGERKMFFAVGAGHLSGEMGVISLLKKEGYTLEPVRLTLDSTPPK